MTITLPAFTPLEDSLWLTLCGRALDNRSSRPILGDATSDQIVRTLDYDYDKLHIDTNFRLSVALRAKKLDQVVGDFLARHPDAVVLDLGVGLDTRHARLTVPARADWYDVDFPAVAAVRERLIPADPNRHVIGADVRDPGWLDAVPTGRPAVIVADGLMGFLSEDEMVSLWNRLLSHFPSGELVFNAYTRFAVWVARHARGTKSVAGLMRFPGMDDPRKPESWNPKLRLVREIVLSNEPEVAEFPPRWRLFQRLIAHSTTLSRMASFVLHYRF
ncbi:class I SAM-dependent methyltransferase [Cryptosporangium aurantiacum]|uniref:O-Methyltransferase involved in polyketide biosynthesis n=1 Tax=Cryptosporangium aurantiacum TaxID=134849 RepID=A0A1M7RBK1_9ACTN|nr:class I SAM-dependent methyltransferase [Cryptosporangium aurantiacum]SHN43438.1 O-Methyltransferase involved in polyketide biosynthesis [Cryptosporangium aurantiacum]